MNIALLHYSAPPVVGGVESVLAHHARLMADAGHAVRIVAGRGGSFDPRIVLVSLPIVDSLHPEVVAVKVQLDGGRVPPEFATLRDRILAQLRQALDGVDLLIAHNVCSLAKNLPLTAALRLLAGERRLRMALWHHDLAWTTPRYRAELHHGAPWDLLRTDWPGADQVVVSSTRRQELSELAGIPIERIHVIPNGLDVATFLKLEELTAGLVGRLSLAEAEPLLLLPVRITPRKNIELAVRTIAALGAHFARPMLVVTGPPGPHNPANVRYFDELRSLRHDLGLEGSVHFLAELVDGYLSDSVIADLYRLADGLVLPSREEGFGIPMLEAGLSRLPIFCADIPPLRELVDSQATYFLPDASPEQVAASVAERLSEDPVYRWGVRVRQDYSWQGVYTRLIDPLLTGGGDK